MEWTLDEARCLIVWAFLTEAASCGPDGGRGTNDCCKSSKSPGVVPRLRKPKKKKNSVRDRETQVVKVTQRPFFQT